MSTASKPARDSGRQVVTGDERPGHHGIAGERTREDAGQPGDLRRLDQPYRDPPGRRVQPRDDPEALGGDQGVIGDGERCVAQAFAEDLEVAVPEPLVRDAERRGIRVALALIDSVAIVHVGQPDYATRDGLDDRDRPLRGISRTERSPGSGTASPSSSISTSRPAVVVFVPARASEVSSSRRRPGNAKPQRGRVDRHVLLEDRGHLHVRQRGGRRRRRLLLAPPGGRQGHQRDGHPADPVATTRARPS